MPKVTLPAKNKNWNPSYVGPFLGDFVYAYNINLRKKQGYLFVSNKMFPHTVTADIAAITTATDFVYSNFDGTLRAWATADKLYKIAGYTASKFAADALTSTPTGLTDSDMCIHGRASTGHDICVVSTATNLSRFNRDVSTTAWEANWWTDTVVNGGLNQAALISGKHILKTFGNAPILFITDGYKLHSVATPNSPTDKDVRNSRLVFPATYDMDWMECTSDRVYIGLSDNNSDGLPSLVIEYDPVNETVRQFVEKDGATIGWKESDEIFIITYKGYIKKYNGKGFSVVKNGYFPSVFGESITFTLPHRNGIATVDGMPHFNLGSFSFRYPGGIWIYDHEFERLCHIKSFTLSDSAASSFGDGWPNSSFGALLTITGSDLLAGADVVQTISTGITAGIFYSSSLGGVSGLSRGHFITPRIPSSEIKDYFRNVLIKYLPTSDVDGTLSGSIVVKYRTAENANSMVGRSGTWASSTTFTMASIPAALTAGKEITIWRGNGSGMLAHVVSIASLTVTIDSSPDSTPTGDFTFIINDWTKIDTITSLTQMSQILELPENQAEWVQFKVEIRELLGVEEIQVGRQVNLKLESS